MPRHITILGMGPSANQRAFDIERYIPANSEIWGLNNGYLSFPTLRARKKFTRMFELHAWEYLSKWNPGIDPLTGQTANHFACLEQLGCEVITGQHLPIIRNQTQIDWEEVFSGGQGLVYFLGSPSIMLAQALYEHDHGEPIEQIDSWGIDTMDPQHQQQRTSWAFWLSRAIERGIRIGGTALAFMGEPDKDEGLSGIRELITQRLRARRKEGPVTDYAVASYCTDDDYYRPKMERLEEQARNLGLEFVGHVVPVAEGQTPAEAIGAAHWGLMRKLLDRAGKSILYIDADDELLARPSFPVCDVGTFRNPEIDAIGSKLQVAPYFFVAPTEAGHNFLDLREELARITGTNKHRAMCAAVDLLATASNRNGVYADLTPYGKGCIRYNPSPIGHRPQTLTS